MLLFVTLLSKIVRAVFCSKKSSSFWAESECGAAIANPEVAKIDSSNTRGKTLFSDTLKTPLEPGLWLELWPRDVSFYLKLWNGNDGALHITGITLSYEWQRIVADGEALSI